MRRVSVLPLVALTLFLPNAVFGQTQACLGADSLSTNIIAAINSIMTPNDVIRLKAQVPVVAPSEIVLITDEAICIQARNALNAYIISTSPGAPNPVPARPLYVLRVGQYFASLDPDSQAGEWMVLDFWDGVWKHVSTMLPF